ncbi:MAG: Arginine--tRNA ligase [Candidatus Berkelbacteria bacterium Gr01-1014_85]|uniref:Arginine--tRNA ligase n=1 Tax=Candidatus Berkelbacteria bacterium Gr01-1014_85 TaxID=2017150 RepID=A0A554JDM3_9BACT|nr:MAG: Arginine--tRNA ligase [Candidatus Berkelbacteria bacterium Gr01-1014_85]
MIKSWLTEFNLVWQSFLQTELGLTPIELNDEPELSWQWGARGRGDLVNSAALKLGQRTDEPPYELAERLASGFQQCLPLGLAVKIEVARPGFLNLYFSQSCWPELTKASQGAPEINNAGRTDQQSRHWLIEFGQPNTHKVPHIGHLFSYVFGQALANLFEATGDRVTRLNYQGDIGPHVAKCLYAISQQPFSADQLSGEELALARVNYLQSCYQAGALAYADDPTAKIAIDQINQALYRGDQEWCGLWLRTRQWSLDYYQLFEAEIGIKYTKSYLESQLFAEGQAIAQKATEAQNGQTAILVRDQGAIIFKPDPEKPTEAKLHTRVFISSADTPTYEAKELGLFQAKLRDFEFDYSLTTTANEQNGYFQVVNYVASRIWPTRLAGKIEHLGYGLMNLTTGKMSSRTGQMVTAFDLVAQTKQAVSQYLAANRDYSLEQIEEICQAVAWGAIKYSFLKQTATKNMSFDLASSISFEGDSGPYLQYTYARTQTLLAKAKSQSSEQGTDSVSELVYTETEQQLILTLLAWPDVLTEAKAMRSLHQVATWLYRLASQFSKFYEATPVNHEANPVLRQRRLKLVQSVATGLREGLALMGIECLDQI